MIRREWFGPRGASFPYCHHVFNRQHIHAMVNLAIIGLGSHWETRYVPVLQRLCDRIRVRAVFDSVASRAAQAAAPFGAAPIQGIRALLDRSDVQAVLLLDSAWYGQELLRLVCGCSKPVYIAQSLGGDVDRLQQLHDVSLAEGQTLMPEFGHRYTPSTSRLQELVATHLGRPRRVTIEATAASSAEQNTSANGHPVISLVSLLDWCCYLFDAHAVRVENMTSSDRSEERVAKHSVLIHFESAKDSEEAGVAELHLDGDLAWDNSGAGSKNCPGGIQCHVRRHQVVCENGTADVKASAEISWSNHTRSMQETLTADRSEFDVMLDHFCRRVAGGLVPVANISDLCQSLVLADATETSLRTGEAIRV